MQKRQNCANITDFYICTDARLKLNTQREHTVEHIAFKKCKQCYEYAEEFNCQSPKQVNVALNINESGTIRDVCSYIAALATPKY